MTSRTRLGLLCGTAWTVLIVPGPAGAGPHDNARFALHATDVFVPSKAYPTVCSATPTALDLHCQSFDVTRDAPGGATVYAVVVGAGGVGVIGASCGVAYSGSPGTGIDPQWVTWTGCSDGLEFPNGPDGGADWPGPGGGIRITWATCQNQQTVSGVSATLGAFYVYAYDQAVFRLTPNNNLDTGPELNLAACGGGTTSLMDVWPIEYHDCLTGRVEFGGYLEAWLPCGEGTCPFIVPVAPTTWGKLKTQYLRTGE